MADLSPAAQRVFWEFNRAASGKPDDWHYLPAIAAALRAAADEVVPEEPDLTPDEARDLAIWGKWRQRTRTRDKLLAIAAELEQEADTTTETTP